MAMKKREKTQEKMTYYDEDDLITPEEERLYSADILPEDLDGLGKAGQTDRWGRQQDRYHGQGHEREEGPMSSDLSHIPGETQGEDLEEDPDLEMRLEQASERRARRRKRERRTRTIFWTGLVILLAALLCFCYAAVLVPQDRDLPWPAFLGRRPSQVPEALSFLDRDAGSGKKDAAISLVDQRETQAAVPASEAAGPDQGQAATQPDGADPADETGEPGADTSAQTQTQAQPQTQTQAQPAAASGANGDAVARAALQAQQYDYDGAIATLQAVPDYESDASITDAISQYQATKASCLAVDVTTVPHIFYHSLMNDPARALNADIMGQGQADGFNAWMTTVDEFDQVTQRLYDSGYVYVRLRDLVVETQDADGTPHFAPNTNLLLPPGKKAIVLSVDDLSYYHSYEPAGYPDKLVLDDQGQVKCHYVDGAGQESVGDYDVVPRLNTFLAQHPDGCYKGARGLIALTGYNGVFGYRTDTDYVKKEHLMEDQAAWLAAHPDFDFDKDVADAKVIAQALKDEGWEFASHTWGHLSVTDKTADHLKEDNEKWVATVQPIVGPTDTIIFAHGNDIGNWEGYKDDNAQYQYYNSAGYHFYCNVDGSVPNWVQITDKYVRQGRIDVDGYRLWLCRNGEDTSLSKIMDTTGIFSDQRPTPVVANGQS